MSVLLENYTRECADDPGISPAYIYSALMLTRLSISGGDMG